MKLFKQRELIKDLLKNDKNLIIAEGEVLISIQRKELEMLDDINAICQKNGIDIFLGGGSLLGAIRHGGFIPWDDDIDLNIPRKFVDKFIELIELNFKQKYVIQYNNKNMICPFIKIKMNGTIIKGPLDNNSENGVCIDIFIIENVPNSIIERYFFGMVCTTKLFFLSCLNVYKNDNRLYLNVVKQSTISYINYLFKRTLGLLWSKKEYYVRAIECDKLFSKYKDVDTKMVCIPTGRKHYFGELYSKNMFSENKIIKFEKISCKVPVQYDKYLKNLYGDDYMKIPEEEKREHHYMVEYKL